MLSYTLAAADCRQREKPGNAMILFTLRCARGHQFEGWFRDGDGFEAEGRRDRLSSMRRLRSKRR